MSVLQATFPKTHGEPFFEIMTKPNNQNKTPLQLAIENGNNRLVHNNNGATDPSYIHRVLTALQERRNEREKAASIVNDLFLKQRESLEKLAWEEFWNQEGPGLLHYACCHGTVETVKCLIIRGVPHLTRQAYFLTVCTIPGTRVCIVLHLVSITAVYCQTRCFAGLHACL